LKCGIIKVGVGYPRIPPRPHISPHPYFPPFLLSIGLISYLPGFPSLYPSIYMPSLISNPSLSTLSISNLKNILHLNFLPIGFLVLTLYFYYVTLYIKLIEAKENRC